MFTLENFSTRSWIENIRLCAPQDKKVIAVLLERNNIKNYEQLRIWLEGYPTNGYNIPHVDILKKQLAWAQARLIKVNNRLIGRPNRTSCLQQTIGAKFGYWYDPLFQAYQQMMKRGVDGVDEALLSSTDKNNYGDVLLCNVNNPLTVSGIRGEALSRLTIRKVKELLSTVDPKTLKSEFLSQKFLGLQTGMDVIRGLEKYHQQLSRQASAQPTPVSSANLLEYQLEEKQEAIGPHFQTIAKELMNMTNLLIWGPMTEAKKQRLENACYDENSELRRSIIRLLALNTTYDETLNFREADIRTKVLKRMLKKEQPNN